MGEAISEGRETEIEGERSGREEREKICFVFMICFYLLDSIYKKEIEILENTNRRRFGKYCKMNCPAFCEPEVLMQTRLEIRNGLLPFTR